MNEYVLLSLSQGLSAEFRCCMTVSLQFLVFFPPSQENVSVQGRNCEYQTYKYQPSFLSHTYSPSRTLANHLPDVSVSRSGEHDEGRRRRRRERGDRGIISHLSGSWPRRRRQAREMRERWEVRTTLFFLSFLLLFKEHVQTILWAVFERSCEIKSKVCWGKNKKTHFSPWNTIFISCLYTYYCIYWVPLTG